MKDSDRRPGQKELAFRAGDNLPFVDKLLVKGVIGTIMEQMKEIKDGTGEITYSFPLSEREKERVKDTLFKRHGGFVFRIGAIYETPMIDGMGTIFEIRKKQKRR